MTSSAVPAASGPHWRALWAGVLPVALLAGLGRAQSTHPSVAEIEQQTLQARLRIKTAVVKMRVDSRRFPADAAGSEKSERTLWFDGAHRRGDIVRQEGGDVGIRFTDCVNCPKAGQGVSGNGIPNNASSILAVDGNPDQFKHAIDPRALGYYPMIASGLYRARLDGVVGSANREAPTATAEGAGPAQCWALRWTTNQKVRIAVWTCPAKGWNVLKMELESPTEPGAGALPVKSSLVSEVEQVGGSGVWYPRRVTFKQAQGATPLMEETIDITEAKINEPVDPSLFTLTGLGLKDGTYILSRNRDETGFLRDGVIVPPSAPPGLVDPTPVEGAGRDHTNLWLVIASAAFAVAATTLIVTRRLRRGN